jgi:phosphoserine phosphatase RsbU/P
MQHEVYDTWHYFSRQIEPALQAKPWYQRWPLGIWKTFLSMAFRLSPPRRSVFALAALLLVLSVLRYGFEAVLSWFVSPPSWGLLSAILLFALLILELRDKLVLGADVEIARQIQFGLLPAAQYDREGVRVTAAMRPAQIVGGDYFDVLDLGAGQLAIVVADVAGKGVPAAMLMALLQGSLRTLITAGFRASRLVTTLNTHLNVNIPANRFVTLFYGELDALTGRLRYINAGHNAPFLLGARGVERLSATGVALGFVPDAVYDEAQTLLGPSDHLFAFTDGVTEALDVEEREYGEDRLQAVLERHRHMTDADLLQQVEADVSAHSKGVRQYDDMTLLLVTREVVRSL